jgi:hypothetical protein
MKLPILILWLAVAFPFMARCADSAPAIAVFTSSGLPLPGIDSNPHLIVGIWPDGRMIWSRDQRSGGRPYLSARVEPKSVQALLDRFERENVFDEKDFRHSWVGPDSPFTTIWLQSGDRQTRLESWHEQFETQPHLVALSIGVTALNGRTRENALQNDTKEYQRFRQIWADLRNAVATLIPKHGRVYTGPTALDLGK